MARLTYPAVRRGWGMEMAGESRKHEKSEARTGFGGGFAVVVLVFAVSLCACTKVVTSGESGNAAPGASEVAPVLTAEVVKKIAHDAALEHGAKIVCYHQPSVTFEPSEAEPSWRVSFQTKDPTPPGGHFVVVVNDLTAKATYFTER